MPWLLHPLSRCSWLTWAVLLVATLTVALIALPGDPASPYITLDGTPLEGWRQQLDEEITRQYTSAGLGPNERVVVDQYQHGWPLPCVTRGFGRVQKAGGAFVRGHRRTQPALSIRLPSDGDSFTSTRIGNSRNFQLVPRDWEVAPLSWSDYSRWPLTTDAAEWRIGNLLIDLTVCLAIPIVAAAAAQWWVRRRGGVLRFRLVDLAVFVVVCSVAFGWYRSHANLRQIEQRLEANGSPFLFYRSALSDEWEWREQGVQSFNSYNRRYSGPDWLRRLVGADELVRFAKHLVAVQLVPDKSWSTNVEELSNLHHVESVSLPRGATLRVIEQLERLPRLRTLQLGFARGAAQQRDFAEADLSAERWLTAQDLRSLHTLPIKELGLLGEELLAEDIERVLSLPKLERLELVEPSITLPQLDALRKQRPHIEITCVWGESNISTISPDIQYRFRETPPGDILRRIESVQSQRAGRP